MANISDSPVAQPAHAVWHARWFWPAIIVLIIAVALGAVWVSSKVFAPPKPVAATEMPINPIIEDRYGVRFTQVALTAENGWVDLRYRVLDPSKVMGIFGTDASLWPKLINEETGRALELNLYAHKHAGFEAGLVYFIIYINYNTTFKAGDVVTIQVGDQKLEHIAIK